MTAPLDTLVTVFGGSGFLGRHVVRALAQRDYRLRVGVRRPELAGHLQPLGKVGQINPVQANVRYPASLEAAMRGAHVVVNLVGILSEGGAQRFNTVQARGAQAIAEAAAKIGARMVHVSAIGADDDMEQRRADIVDAVGRVDTGAGVIVLTDMFGGTPSNLAISVMESGRTEVIAGMNLPMLIKLSSIRKGDNMAAALDEAQAAGRKYINVASQLLSSK